MEQDEWDQHPSTDATNPESWAKHLKRKLKQHWQPKALPPPVVDADLPKLTAIERAAEVLRYTLSRLFFWMAPGGSLKEWMRFNLRASFIIGVPLALVAPVITFGLGQIQLWLDLLAKTTSNLILFPLSVLLIIGLISGLVYIAKSLLIMRLRYSQQRRDPYY